MPTAIKETPKTVSLRPGFQDTQAYGLLKQDDVDVNACYQCRKCASGCPLSDLMDLTPVQIIQAVRLGLEDLALNSKTIWLCTACETCTTRCPHGIDIAKVNSTLRILAHRRGIAPKVPSVAAFDRAFLGNVKLFGRVFELGLVNQLKLMTRNFMQDMDLAAPMFLKGKIGLFPSFAGFSKMRRLLGRIKKARRDGEGRKP